MNRTNTKSFDPTQFSSSNPYLYTIAEQCAILQTFKNKRAVYMWQNSAEVPYWNQLNPEKEIQFDFFRRIYSTTLPTKSTLPITNIPPRPMPNDIPCFPPSHVCHNRIVYDPDAREYYDKTTDMFLSDDDIAFYGLRLYKDIATPLPNPLPENYWDAVPEESK